MGEPETRCGCKLADLRPLNPQTTGSHEKAPYGANFEGKSPLRYRSGKILTREDSLNAAKMLQSKVLEKLGRGLELPKQKPVETRGITIGSCQER